MVGLVETLSLLFTVGERILKKLEELKPKEIQKVAIVTEPYTMTKTVIDRISTSATKEPDKADMEIKAPVDAECRVLSITLIPDATFKTEGLFCLKINDVEELRIDAQADLTDFGTINVPLPNEGKVLQRGKSVKVLAWNPTGNPVKLSAQVHLVR